MEVQQDNQGWQQFYQGGISHGLFAGVRYKLGEISGQHAINERLRTLVDNLRMPSVMVEFFQKGYHDGVKQKVAGISAPAVRAKVELTQERNKARMVAGVAKKKAAWGNSPNSVSARLDAIQEQGRKIGFEVGGYTQVGGLKAQEAATHRGEHLIGEAMKGMYTKEHVNALRKGMQEGYAERGVGNLEKLGLTSERQHKAPMPTQSRETQRMSPYSHGMTM